MHPKDVVLGGKGGVDPVQIQPLQRAQNSVQTGHLFGVSGRRDMAKTIGVSDQSCCHMAKE